jgi:spore maturation protein CgeB
MMKPATEWLSVLAGLDVPDTLEVVQGRRGDPTLKKGDVFLHSRYDPRTEAARLVDAADLDPKRPVLVVGLGLGYHVLALLNRGMTVAVVDPEPAVAKLALDGPLAGCDLPLGLGDADAITEEDAFRAFARLRPQTLVHPPSANTAPGFAEAILARLADAGLAGQRLRVAVVGPMYGGSLPIAGYLDRAFRNLGHRTLLVDNSAGFPLYDELSKTLTSKKASGQLTELLVNYLNEWTYARVAEFAPEICIVIAQAPVGPQFPARLAESGIVTAFWYIENWRHMPYWRDIAPAYDYFFHIQPGEFEEKLGAIGCTHHAFVPTGCDPTVHKPVELSEAERERYGCDISFAGAGYHNRNQLFSGLTDYDFRIWGVDWAARELQPLLQDREERFTPEKFAKIAAASKINLNLHSSATHDGVDPRCDAVNPRVFEIAACGAFQLCDPCQGLEDFFDFETELPVYHDLAELRAKIDHFLANPDERLDVAGRARERALREHTYEKRAQRMLDLLLEQHGARLLKKGVRVQRTVSEVARQIGRDTPLGSYLATLPDDLMFTQANLNERIPLIGSRLSFPEGVFAYLRELRNSAEALFAEMD